jgi:hypothetical protein
MPTASLRVDFVVPGVVSVSREVTVLGTFPLCVMALIAVIVKFINGRVVAFSFVANDGRWIASEGLVVRHQKPPGN